MSPKSQKPNFAALAGAAIATTAAIAGILVAGAEVTNPAWWPWANLAGVPLMCCGLLTHRLLHRQVPRR
jgi:hypothetical protein